MKILHLKIVWRISRSWTNAYWQTKNEQKVDCEYVSNQHQRKPENQPNGIPNCYNHPYFHTSLNDSSGGRSSGGRRGRLRLLMVRLVKAVRTPECGSDHRGTRIRSGRPHWMFGRSWEPRVTSWVIGIGGRRSVPQNSREVWIRGRGGRPAIRGCGRWLRFWTSFWNFFKYLLTWSSYPSPMLWYTNQILKSLIMNVGHN